jgi:hypothetical protein
MAHSEYRDLDIDAEANADDERGNTYCSFFCQSHQVHNWLLMEMVQKSMI